MEEKKVLYSKRFPKERPFDLEKEIEQKQLDINMAPANKKKRLARALGCTMEELLEV